MTQTVRSFLDLFKARQYREVRQTVEHDTARAEIYAWNDPMYVATLLEIAVKAEHPYLLNKDDPFGFHRTVKSFPMPKTPRELGYAETFSNITPNYASAIQKGLEAFRAEAIEKNPDKKNKFYSAVVTSVDALYDICDRYRAAALEMGDTRLADALCRIPRQPAQSYYEACLFLTILLYSLRLVEHRHMTLGRFDQYMLPYFNADLARGISEAELFETTELFFLQCNWDSDVYGGIQQGDNGQSMVLGGYDLDGNDQYNRLSEFCMQASLELLVIDPKINLRCSKKTPRERLDFATKLTKQGLGFPQYCNDDIAVPGLISWGYAPEDAVNYTVAACWEYIVPNCAADVPNRGTLNFPLAISNAVHRHLLNCESFADFLNAAKDEVRMLCDEQMALPDIVYPPAPLLSMLVDGCMEAGRDLTECAAKYNNYGCHGAGIANAADALTAVKIAVYDEKIVTKKELIRALNANFEGYTELRNRLLTLPKMGNDEELPDEMAGELMDTFASYLNGKPNRRGGIWRAGTGSAMEYILSAAVCPATPDGRLAKAPYPSSFSPALTTRLEGPLSTIRSLTKFDMKRITNGGPITMELHDSVFRDEEGEKKVAQLVRYFIDRGGHQLQLNAINREILLDAEAHPENYPNLIVRVWGWSGYFCELDPEYRGHIIARTEFTV